MFIERKYEKLKILGHIPKEFKLEGDECNDDDDDYFSYNISDSDTEEDDNPIVSDEKIVEKEYFRHSLDRIRLYLAV